MSSVWSPLEHFEANLYGYFYLTHYDLSITSGLLYFLSLTFFLSFFTAVGLRLTLLPSTAQTFAENIYLGVFGVFKQQISSARVLRFFPLVFTLFMYIFLLNFSSLFVFGVSLTGHIMVTAFLSFTFFLAIIIIGFLNHGKNFFKLFVPQNVPKVLLDFLILIEVFSFLIRPFSLAIRLFANMLAGHTLLGIFAQFGGFIIKNYIIFFAIPVFLLLAVFFLEIAVSVIQAYIFVSLICIYLNDVIILH